MLQLLFHSQSIFWQALRHADTTNLQIFILKLVETVHLLKHRASSCVTASQLCEMLASASLRKPRRKPNLAAECVWVSLSESVRSSGRRCLNDKQREGGCLLIDSVITSLAFHIVSLCVCLPQDRTALNGCVGEEAQVFVFFVSFSVYYWAWLLE